MTMNSLTAYRWLVAGFRLGQALDAFDVNDPLVPDEFVRGHLLGGLRIELHALDSEIPHVHAALGELGEADRAWANAGPQDVVAPIYCLFPVLQRLRGIEAHLLGCDLGNDHAAQCNAALQLGIELGRVRLVVVEEERTITCDPIDRLAEPVSHLPGTLELRFSDPSRLVPHPASFFR
jgi:hypothetical protein